MKPLSCDGTLPHSSLSPKFHRAHYQTYSADSTNPTKAATVARQERYIRSRAEAGEVDSKIKDEHVASAPSILMEGAPVFYCIFGFLDWVLLAVIVSVWYIVQFLAEGPLQRFAYDYWIPFSVAYCLVVVMHTILTTRDG